MAPGTAVPCLPFPLGIIEEIMTPVSISPSSAAVALSPCGAATIVSVLSGQKNVSLGVAPPRLVRLALRAPVLGLLSKPAVLPLLLWDDVTHSRDGFALSGVHRRLQSLLLHFGRCLLTRGRHLRCSCRVGGRLLLWLHLLLQRHQLTVLLGHLLKQVGRFFRLLHTWILPPLLLWSLPELIRINGCCNGIFTSRSIALGTLALQSVEDVLVDVLGGLPEAIIPNLSTRTVPLLEVLARDIEGGSLPELEHAPRGPPKAGPRAVAALRLLEASKTAR
mmetsp:Transcript_29367/g.66167  ORF Transcript_29367/g.66167 Transcript_29367/m.66167 type:complete len:277 (-) Transcript_29367:410-1240(-)